MGNVRFETFFDQEGLELRDGQKPNRMFVNTPSLGGWEIFLVIPVDTGDGQGGLDGEQIQELNDLCYDWGYEPITFVPVGNGRVLAEYHWSYTTGKAIPEPTQLPWDVLDEFLKETRGAKNADR